MKHGMIMQRSAVLIFLLVFDQIALNGAVLEGGQRSSVGIRAHAHQGRTDADSDGASDAKSPVMKAMDLINGMQKKIHEDTLKEKKLFGEYELWCSKEAQETKFKVMNSESKLEALQAKIAKADSDESQAKLHLQSMAGREASDEANMKAATKQRNEERVQFKAIEQELMNGMKVTAKAIDKVKQAIVKAGGEISLLEKKGGKQLRAQKKGPSKARTKGMKAFNELMKELANAANLATSSDSTKAASLLEKEKARAAEEDSASEDADAGDDVKVHKQNLKMLQDIQTSSQASLERARNREEQAQHSYDEMKGAIEDKISTEGRDMRSTKGGLAAAEEAKAEAKNEFAIEKEDLEKYKKYLTEVERTCMERAVAFQQQQKTRVEEQEAIKEAKRALQKVMGTKAAKKNLNLVQKQKRRAQQTAADDQQASSETASNSGDAVGSDGLPSSESDTLTLTNDASGTKSTSSDIQITEDASTEVPVSSFYQISSEHGKHLIEVKRALRALEKAQDGREVKMPEAMSAMTFMQVNSGLRGGPTSLLVLRKVKTLAAETRSPQLTQLASRIGAILMHGSGSGSGDPFVKVRKMIREMMDQLKKANNEEMDKKMFCDQEKKHTAQNYKERKEDLDDKTEENNLATAEIATLRQDLSDLAEELSNIVAADKKATELREKEHKEHILAYEDLEKGLAGVGMAIKALRDYYNMDTTEEKQMKQDVASDMRVMAAGGHPKFSSAPVGAHASATVVMMLEMIEQSFRENLAELASNDRKAQEEYDELMQNSKVMKAQKEGDQAHKQTRATQLERQITELAYDIQAATEQLQAVEEYKAKLEKECAGKVESRSERIKRRAAEMDGLKEALVILEGIAAR
eukprot:TRINITY_DN64045_c0_g1_i1.p1 TRINITY_DN64045_c0_g1~~TRINITY_DN64045_c0_g1_i1.p1  ORF type:complete len:865 (+),score=281.35 TRINITY_DN64045_c0_g1_i1:109-2703(+)